MAQEADAAPRPGALARLAGFVRAVRAETAKVTWPTRTELTQATKGIVVFVLILAAMIGLMDTVFQFLLVTAVAKIF